MRNSGFANADGDKKDNSALYGSLIAAGATIGGVLISSAQQRKIAEQNAEVEKLRIQQQGQNLSNTQLSATQKYLLIGGSVIVLGITAIIIVKLK